MENHEPQIRVMALHALAYCERLFYLEEVEGILVADSAVFAGRALHEDLGRPGDEDGEWINRDLSSEDLGLVGKVDVLRRRDGAFIPYEHKRGRARRDGKKAAVWPSDALQAAAYAMLLEEETGEPVTEARVRYHADNVTIRTPVDETARAAVRDAVARARELRRSTERPPVAANDRICIKCSLTPVCLPEEERLADDPKWESIRLFPPDRELKTLHVSSPGARVSRAGETLKIVDVGPEAATLTFPIRETGALVLHGYPQITTQALHFCARNDIAVHWLSGGGNYVAGLASGAGGVQRRLRQYKALADPEICLDLAKKTAAAKVEGGLRYILRTTRGLDRDYLELSGPIQMMRDSLAAISRAESLDALRGHEGMGARAWFQVLPKLLRPDCPEEMIPKGRSRRPPKDRFNALLGFGYALLYQAVLQAALSVGLEPALGYYHQPRSAGHPLVLDLMELFRMPIWDVPLIGSVNRLQWDVEADFDIAGKRVWLSDSGRRKAIELFERRLQDAWKHPAVGYSLSYSRLIELETRLLEKEWTGAPGLFARMRIR